MSLKHNLTHNEYLFTLIVFLDNLKLCYLLNFNLEEVEVKLSKKKWRNGNL